MEETTTTQRETYTLVQGNTLTPPDSSTLTSGEARAGGARVCVTTTAFPPIVVTGTSGFYTYMPAGAVVVGSFGPIHKQNYDVKSISNLRWEAIGVQDAHTHYYYLLHLRKLATSSINKTSILFFSQRLDWARRGSTP